VVVNKFIAGEVLEYRGGRPRESRDLGMLDLIGRLVGLKYWYTDFLVENREESVIMACLGKLI